MSPKLIEELDERDELFEEDWDDESSSDSDMDDDGKEILKARASQIAKFNQYTPQASVYKCWSINLFRGRGKLILFMFLVLMIQISTPLILFGYARRQLRTHDVVNLWTDLAKKYAASADSGRDFVTNETVPLSPLTWAWDDPTINVLLIKKFVGLSFMVLVFLQNDQALLGYDLEAHNFKKYFPMVPRWIRWMDNGVNAWTLTMIGIAMGPLFEVQDTVVDVLLNSIGLIFVANLDNLAASGICYGFDQKEFDELVETFRRRYLKELIRDGPHHTDDTLPLVSVLISFFRLFNIINMSVQMSAYAVLTLEPNEDLKKQMNAQVPTIHMPSFSKLLESSDIWAPMGIGFLVLGGAMSSIRFAQGCFEARNASSRKLEKLRTNYQVHEFDAQGFFASVILRRPDPRYQIAFFKKVAMKEAGELAKED